MAVETVALYSRLFDGTIHALHLPVGPGVIGLGQIMINTAQKTDPVKWMALEACSQSFAILQKIGELDVVIREDSID
jgi:hypothetical protein